MILPSAGPWKDLGTIELSSFYLEITIMCGAQTEKLRMRLVVIFSVRVTDGGTRVEMRGMNEAV